jgi:hypothetical protein
LERLETKEYILFRLHKAGGSGIFTDAALERLYEYTRGVPRRINAWCDLALVAGFAEGRKEIDADFIDTVVAAQGGTLEEEGESTELAIPAAEEGQTSDRGNHLKQELADLSGRITRLEGLCLEISNHLIPLVTQLLAQQQRLASPPLPEELPVAVVPEEPEPDADIIQSPGKGSTWWSRLWRGARPH